MMLFDHEDRRVIMSAVMRKASESASLVSNDSLPLSKRNTLASAIGKNMFRLQAMYRVADNDFDEIESDLVCLTLDEYRFPPGCLMDYNTILTADGRDEEGYLMVLDHLIDSFTPLLRNAKDLADLMLKGYPPVVDSDRLEYIRIRDIMIRLRERCQDSDESVPYRTAMRYIDHVIDECNILLRIGAYKNVSTEECAHCVDEYYLCEPSVFESIFLDVLDSDEAYAYHMHHEFDDEHITIILAKCITNSMLD